MLHNKLLRVIQAHLVGFSTNIVLSCKRFCLFCLFRTSLSFAGCLVQLVYTYFPNRVINRHLRMCYPRLRYPGYFVKVHYGGLAAELHPGLLLLESLSKLLKKSLALRCPIGDGCVYLSLPRVG